MSVWSSLKDRFKREESLTPPKPGIYHFVRSEDGEKSRLHLRVEKDGRGLLLVNASRSYHLNPTAVWMTYLWLNNVDRERILQALTSTYSVSAEDADADYAQTIAQVSELIRPDGACPIHDLQLDILAPFSSRPSAPYRMDLALTYRCNNNCAHCYNARPRNHPELTTAQWKSILDELWSIGIPHIVFTGGEPTLREDLPDLIAHAEHNGQITGINTNGRCLSDPAFVQRLVDSGLDHVQITLESHDPAVHDAMVAHPGAWNETVAGLKNVLATRLFVMTNSTLLQANSPHLAQTLEFLRSTGVPTIGLNALIYSGRGANVGSGLPEEDLPALLEQARAFTRQSGQRLIWYTPTQYCHFDPMQLELGVKGCTAALYNMCVEPDGTVLPCQSYYQGLGNLRQDSWNSIWNHELAVNLRERRLAPAACRDCSLLSECGGGCPLAPQTPRQAVHLKELSSTPSIMEM